MKQLQVRGICVHYQRRQILHDVDLPDLENGQLLALVGPNGAGKSTLLRTLAGLVPCKGEVRLGDLELLRCSRTARAERLGFMPQSLPEQVSLSVVESLLGAISAGLGDSRQGLDRAYAILAELGIESLAMRPLTQLSGGQRQLVSLAQAVVRDPQLLLLDEPTSALDLHYQDRVLRLVRRLTDQGRIVIVVLHDLALAARWADRLAVLRQGRVYGSGAIEQTLTPSMLEEVYAVDARVERCSRGRLQVLVDGPVS